MVKTIFILKSDAVPHGLFAEQIRTEAAALLEAEIRSLRYTVTEEPPPFGVIPYDKSCAACLSVVSDREVVATRLRSHPFFYSACEVNEVIPVSNDADRPAVQPTPGICLLTLFNRKRSIDRGTFLHRWHNGHTPLSLRIHPLWSYIRNEVTRHLAGCPFDGIVEEQVRERCHITNPIIFFGGPLVFVWNMIRTFFDTWGFIDYPTMETYFTREYRLR